MLTVACVEVSDYCGRGAEYVAKLQAAVGRHLDEPHVFRVFTDNLLRHWPTLQRTGLEIVEVRPLGGWWDKLQLFSPEAFREGDRVLYFDLDTFIVGPLDELTHARGLIHLGMWGWEKNDFGSGVMAWRHGEHREIWEQFTPEVMEQFRGDQDWLTHLGGWEALPVPLVSSAKYHCKDGPPKGASVLCCHGPKKPHLFDEGWARQAWDGEMSFS